MANKYGESGEAARLRQAYDREKDAGKKAALRQQLGAARQAAGVQRGAGAPNKATGLLGQTPQGINWNPSSAGDATKNQQTLNQWNAHLETQMNRPNEYTPFGSSEYTQNPDGSWSRNTTLGGGQETVNQYQTLLDQSKFYGGFQKSQEAERALQQKYSLGGVAPVLGQNDMLGARQGVEDKLYNSWTARMQPQFDKQNSQFDQKMADRGIPMGSEQFGWGQKQLMEGQNDARQQAMASASAQGLGEMQGLHGMSLTNRQQGIGEYEAQRYAPMNESNMFTQNARGVVSPNVSAMTPVGMQGTDLASTYMAYNPKFAPSGGGGGGGGTGSLPYSSLSSQQGAWFGAGGQQQQSQVGGWGNVASGVANGVANGWLANQNQANKKGLFG